MHNVFNMCFNSIVYTRHVNILERIEKTKINTFNKYCAFYIHFEHTTNEVVEHQSYTVAVRLGYHFVTMLCIVACASSKSSLTMTASNSFSM